MKTKRILWLDFAKGLTIIFVVMTHCIIHGEGSHIENDICLSTVYYINTFIMPLFFAISGYLYKETHTVHKYLLMIYKKATSLLIPYFFFSLLYARHGLILFINSWKQPQQYLWFLYALFFIFIIVGFFDLLNLNYKIQLIIYILLAFIQMLFPWWTGISIHALPSILGYALFFYIGHLFCIFKLDIKNNINIYLFILLIISIFVQMIITGKYFNTDQVYYVDILTKVLSVIIIFSMFMKLRHNNLFFMITKYGKYTLIIYLVHFPIRFIVGDRLLKLYPNLQAMPVIGSIVIFISTLILSLIICYLAKHVMVINFIFYPRKRYIDPIIDKTKWGTWLLYNKN